MRNGRIQRPSRFDTGLWVAGLSSPISVLGLGASCRLRSGYRSNMRSPAGMWPGGCRASARLLSWA